MKDLLVVDGYNVLHASERYRERIDEPDPLPLYSDPFTRARTTLISDVAAFAGRRYEPVVVFDGAGNKAPEHPELHSGGVRILYSAYQQSADELIEKLVTEARSMGRSVLLVTSDAVIQATAGSGPGRVRCISSALLIQEITSVQNDCERSHQETTTPQQKLTLMDRLPADQRSKLENLLRQQLSGK